MIDSKYRKEIDGLRAIAVISVLLYHVGFPFVPGGFTGVDMFFAISGYVIFSKIAQGIENREFSVAEFYKNRVLRIVPTLLLVVSATVAFGFIALTTSEYTKLAESALASILSVSNLYFADSMGYFSDSAESMPLIHTWSLGVEEQFYLIAPIFAVTAGRKYGVKGLRYAIIGIFIASFVYNIYSVYIYPDDNGSFYSPLTRLWEIAAGGIAAMTPVQPKAGIQTRFSGVLTWIGAAGLVASVVALSNGVPFPGWAAALPVFSAVLVLMDRHHGSPTVYRLLSSRVLTFIGTISYSLYLVHWPIIVYTRLILGRDLWIPEMLLVIGLSIAIAAVIHRFFETPLRFARSGTPWRRARLFLVASSAVWIAACAGIIALGGLDGRMTPRARGILLAQREASAHKRPCEPFERAAKIDRASICHLPGGADPGVDYLLWGDSHAGMYGDELADQMKAHGQRGVLATMADCQNLLDTYTSKPKNREVCSLLGQEVLRLVREERIPTVILAARWATLGSSVRAPGDGNASKTIYDVRNGGSEIGLDAALARTVRAFTALGARVVIIGPSPEMDFDVPNMLARSANLGARLPVSPRKAFDERQAIVLRALSDVARIPGVSVVYPHGALCDAEACRFADGDAPYYTDDDHLTKAGVDVVLPAIMSTIRP